MINIQINSIVTFIYLFCTLFYLIDLLFKIKKIGLIATTFTIVAFLSQFAAIVIRGIESYKLGLWHLPIRGPYEGITFSAWVIILFYIVIQYKFKTRVFGAFILPFVFVLMVFATLSPKINSSIVPMPEVLQGNYINYHLASCFIGYAAFSISFVFSILYLFKREKRDSNSNEVKSMIPSRNVLDDISYKMIAIGFVMFTILIATGMFRTRIIWGSYWQWDSVQTWSLICWIVYAVILHGRFTWKWSGRITAVLSIVGFALSIISFLTGAGFIFTSGHFPITE
jgi:cytochrome c-type biogenesis protein CcsB